MKINLDPWQEKILKHKGDLGLCTGRRVGKTYIFARKAVDHMVKYGKPIIVVSLTEEQAMIIIQMALNYAKEAYPRQIGSGRFKPTLKTFTIIRNKKPVLMKSRPVGATGDATRGFEGGVLVVDEASRMPKIFWMAALPILLTTAGEIWMCSTPFGKQGYFWERYNETMNLKAEDARFDFIHLNTEEVMKNRKISNSWTKAQREGALKILANDKKDMSDLEYGQEYMGLFLEELSQFFSDESISSCMTLQRGFSLPYPSGDNFLGVDVARMGGDETVLFSLNLNGKTLSQFDMEITKKTMLTDTIQKIKIADLRHKYNKIYIDDGGMGVGVFDPLLADEQTKRKVVAINNASRSLTRDKKRQKKLLKEDLYNNLKVLMEQGRLNLFKDEKIRESLRSIQSEYTNGKLRIFGRYSHITEALIRAAWCVKDKGLNIWIA